MIGHRWARHLDHDGLGVERVVVSLCCAAIIVTVAWSFTVAFGR